MNNERRHADNRVKMTVSEPARRYLEALDSDKQALVLLYGIDEALSDSGWMPVTLPLRQLRKRRRMKPFITQLGAVSVVIPDAGKASQLNGTRLCVHNGALVLE